MFPGSLLLHLALGNLGNSYMALGDVHRAIQFYEEHLGIARAIGDQRGEGNSLGNLGLVYAALGDAPRAISFYEQRLLIARKIGDRRGEANSSWNLGNELAKQGELARAVELMQVLVDFEREIGHADVGRHAAEVEKLRGRLAEGDGRK